MKELGMKATKKRVVKSKDQVNREYVTPFQEAVKKLHNNGNNLDKAKLTKDQCGAILTLGFGTFTKVGAKKVSDL